MARAVLAHTRTTWNLTDRPAEALFIVTDTDPTNNCSMPAAFHITARAGPARVAEAKGRVWRVRAAVETDVVTGRAHPSGIAVLALRRVHGKVAVPAVHAVGSARAVWRLTAGTLPAFQAIAGRRLLARVAVAMATARLPKAHAVWARQATDTIGRNAWKTRAVAWAAGNVADVTPEALFIVTDTDTSTSINLAVSAAFRVTAEASPARVADTDARVFRGLDTIHTRLVAIAAHPRSNTVDAANLAVRQLSAGSAVKAVNGLARAV